MKSVFAFILAFSFLSAAGQSKKIEVLTLGTFHFEFRNLDVSKTALPDQVDVLQPRYQKEIEDIFFPSTSPARDVEVFRRRCCSVSFFAAALSPDKRRTVKKTAIPPPLVRDQTAARNTQRPR